MPCDPVRSLCGLIRFASRRPDTSEQVDRGFAARRNSAGVHLPAAGRSEWNGELRDRSGPARRPVRMVGKDFRDRRRKVLSVLGSTERLTGIEIPRRTAVARVLWRDDQGRAVLHDEPAWASYRPGERPRAEPEFPADQGVDEKVGQPSAESITLRRMPRGRSSNCRIVGRRNGRRRMVQCRTEANRRLPSPARSGWRPFTINRAKARRRPTNASCLRR